MRVRRVVAIRGIVQGVGFRPFVHRLAAAHGLAGAVRNFGAGVEVDVEGETASLDAFVAAIKAPPPPARVKRLDIRKAEPTGRSGFRIEASAASPDTSIAVGADRATCDACLAEMADPANRRWRHPFITCTECGPRLTVVADLPFDRARTTMAGFPMCAACRAEYEDPGDRRFHAQTLACPACGPRLRFGGAAEPIAAAADALGRGAIVAVKGLGGYHLACDALDGAAVRRLRARKRRDAKPFAVMAADLEGVRALCTLSPADEVLLQSVERPITLLRKLTDCPVAEEVAPGSSLLGVMLPYTPLHRLLLDAAGRPLVMTSANLSDEPMVVADGEAHERLAGIADDFLDHDRDIAMRCDDSVVRTVLGGSTPIRRSRAYAPLPLPVGAGPNVLAVGADQKNVFALVRGGEAFLSPHIGDLDDLSTYSALGEAVTHFSHLLAFRADLVAHDLHPGYRSTRFALAKEGEHVAVQHHHAHVAACMAEHGVAGPVIGVAFDGSGYGPDGAVWGGEFLVADFSGFERVGHLRPLALPGGDAVAREPWRAALAHLLAAYGKEAKEAAAPFCERVGERRWRAFEQAAASPRLAVPTSSVGRLFDAVAALVGLGDAVAFEAQAAMALEGLADPTTSEAYPVEVEFGGTAVLAPEPIVRGVVADLRIGRPRAEIAAKFHNALSTGITRVCAAVRAEHGIRRVALTGGVFQNALLTESAATALERAGFEVLIHRHVPANDGGLALGQAAVALARGR